MAIPSEIAPYWHLILAAEATHGVPAARVSGTVIIESGGDPHAVQRNPQGDSYGLMQIVVFTKNPKEQGWEGHHQLVRQVAGLSQSATRARVIEAARDPEVNITVGARLLRSNYAAHGNDWDKASSVFFLGAPKPPHYRYWDGEDTMNGNSGLWYRDTLNDWIARIEGEDMALRFRQAFIPAGNRNRPGTAMNSGGPRYITVHETGNQNVGANAEMHRRFTHQGGGDESVSFHLVVDDTEAIQLLPFSEIGYHAGDGCDSRVNDLGCFDSIAIETCVNSDGNWEQTLRNLIQLLAKLIRENPTLSVERIRQHNRWSGKNCPQRIRESGRWEWLLGEVRRELDGTSAPEFDGLPAWLPAAYFVAAFPSADPTGVVTKRVIAWINDEERLPIFKEKRDVGTNQNLWIFEEVTFLNDGAKVWLEGEAA